IRDLLGVDFQPADDFPADDSGYGFDNIGDVLPLPPALLEKYLNAAEKIAEAAVSTRHPANTPSDRPLAPNGPRPEAGEARPAPLLNGPATEKERDALKEEQRRHLIVDLIEIKGPYFPDGPPKPLSYRMFVVAEPTASLPKREAARKVIGTFARKAFRRPVPDA